MTSSEKCRLWRRDNPPEEGAEALCSPGAVRRACRWDGHKTRRQSAVATEEGAEALCSPGAVRRACCWDGYKTRRQSAVATEEGAKLFVAPALCAGPVAGTAIRHGGRAPWLQKKERKHNPHCRPTLCGRRSPAGDRAPAYSSKDL